MATKMCFKVNEKKVFDEEIVAFTYVKGMAFSQKVGTISPLVKSQFGTHIIYVKDKSAKQTQTYASVKADIKEFLIKFKL